METLQVKLLSPEWSVHFVHDNDLLIYSSTNTPSDTQGNKMSLSAPTTPISPSSPLTCLHQAVSNYVPQLDGEIALTAGDIIASVKDLGNGWCLGKNISAGNVVGIFPSRCVRFLSAFLTPASQQQHSLDGIHTTESGMGLKSRAESDDRSCRQRRSMSPEVAKRKKGLLTLQTKSKKCPRVTTPKTARLKSYSRNDSLPSEIRYYSSDVGNVLNSGTPLSDEEQISQQMALAASDGKEYEGSAYGTERFLGCDFLSIQKKGRWKKPRMIVKPNLGKNETTEDENRFQIQSEKEEDADDVEFSRSDCRTEMSLQPKCRVAIPPTELHLSNTLLPRCPTMTNLFQTEIYSGGGDVVNLQTVKDRSAVAMGTLNRIEARAEGEIFCNECEMIVRGDGSPHTHDPDKLLYTDYRTVGLSNPAKHGSDVYANPGEAGSKLTGRSLYHDHSENPDKHHQGRGDSSTYRQHEYYSRSLIDTKSYRLIVSVLVGQLLGLVLFLWMFFHLDYGFFASATVGASIAMILSIFLALSRVCRGTAAILIPSISTTRGRLAFIIIISGFLLNGPVNNVYLNVQEISRSMSCSAEQSYNQMMLFLKPFDTMMAQLNGTIGRLQEAAHNVSRGLKPLDDGLSSIERDMYNGRLQLSGTRKTCKNLVDTAFNACATGIHKAQDQCLGVMGALGTVYHHARVVLDRINPERWSTKQNSQQQQLHKRQVVTEDGSLINDIDLSATDRDICEPLDTVLVCQSLNDSETLCQPSKWAGEAIQEAINATQTAMSSLKEALQFYVSSEPYDRNRNVSDIIFQIRQHVRDEFASRTAYFQLVIGILKKLVPTSILLLIYSAYVHLKNYLSRDAYDNIYINNQFRQMDQKRTKMAGESVLPLKGYEKNYVVDTSSGVLGQPEEGLYRVGLCVFWLHLMLSFSCYMFDFVLYWVLALVQRHSRPGFDVTGSDSLDLVVTGEGIIVELLDIFLKGFHPGRWFSFTGDTQACLPVPKPPSVVNLVVLFLLYLLLLVSILFKAYFLRARNSITGFFYREREKTRLIYLYNIIASQRSRLPRNLHQMVRVNHQENQLYGHMGICRKMAACYGAQCRYVLCQPARCLVCKARQDNTFHNCQTDKCQGVYCRECFEDLHRCCPLCLYNTSECYDDEMDQGFDPDIQSYCRMNKVCV